MIEVTLQRAFQFSPTHMQNISTPHTHRKHFSPSFSTLTEPQRVRDHLHLGSAALPPSVAPLVSIPSSSEPHLPQRLILIDFTLFASRTAVPMWEEQLSPAFQQGAAIVTETGPFATAKDATRITTVTKWGLPPRPTSTRPPLLPSTRENVAPRSWSAPWKPWSGNRQLISRFFWKHRPGVEPPFSPWDV